MAVIRRIIKASAPWAEIDAANLRQFLTTPSGQNLLSKLHAMRPRATERKDVAARAIQSGVAEGYEALVDTLVHLTTPQSVDRGTNSNI